MRVVQTLPGPIPTLTISAPRKINSCVMSAVTTLPAIIVLVGYSFLTLVTKLPKCSEYPFATSIQINCTISGYMLLIISSF